MRAGRPEMIRRRVSDKTPWTLERLLALPQEAQITRHICIEGWSQIGQWSGVPLHAFLRRVGADLRARYVYFTCFDEDYSTSIDMASALHPQTLLALDFEQKPLAPQWGGTAPAAHSDQARLQERQKFAIDRGDEHLPERLLGEARLRLVLRGLTGRKGWQFLVHLERVQRWRIPSSFDVSAPSSSLRRLQKPGLRRP
jgi:hypothetical protein